MEHVRGAMESKTRRLNGIEALGHGLALAPKRLKSTIGMSTVRRLGCSLGLALRFAS
jgi:hypothetical protein